MTIIDHKEVYRGRLLQQYKCSTELIKLIDSLIEGQQELEQVLDEILTERSVETAVGAQLDIIGEIVGQPRIIVDITGLEFFGYQGAAGDIDGYGALGDPTLGARYKGLNEANGVLRELGDTEYRLFIKAKIFKNTKDLVTEDLIMVLKYMLGKETSINISETGTAKVTISVIGDIPKSTIEVLVANDVFPRPAGVEYSVLFSSGDGDPFAFDGFVGGSTFGTVLDLTVGGEFQEII